VRFLILTQYYEPEVGAAQVRLGALARELLARGHHIDVVTALPSYPLDRIFPEYRGRLAAVETRGGARVYRTWLVAATGRGLKRVIGYLSFSLSALAGLLAARPPDVIFVESPPPTLMVPAWLIARLRRAVLIMNVSDLWPDSVTSLGHMSAGPMLAAATQLEGWAYAKADFVTAVTDGIRATLTDRKGVAPERILFLPNGVDTDLFSPQPYDQELAARYGVSNCKVIMLAGSLGYGVGLDVILDAAELMRGEQVTFLIVGGGSEYDRLLRAVQERGLPNVRLTGPKSLEEVAHLYSVTDIGLMTLRDSPLFEGTRPARVYPAMAAGKPVVYSGSGEGARIIASAEAGVVVPPEDPAALARAIRQLLADEGEAHHMGERGREYVERELGWPRLVGSWLEDLLQRMPPGERT
jgi:colanic acid biosynthesis glycosyl transferase WcaI